MSLYEIIKCLVWVSVSTSFAQSRHCDLDIFSLSLSLVQRSARVSMESRYQHLSPSLVIETQTFSVSVLVSSLRLRFFSLGLGIVIETQTFSVSVSVSSLRLRPFQSRSKSWSQSHHWDWDLFSFGLGLIIETQTFPVSVLVSPLRLSLFWSRS